MDVFTHGQFLNLENKIVDIETVDCIEMMRRKLCMFCSSDTEITFWCQDKWSDEIFTFIFLNKKLTGAEYKSSKNAPPIEVKSIHIF